MAPSACLSPVATLALLLLIAGFALGGTYTVVLWTTDKYSAGMDGDVSIRFIGDKCQTGWHDLDHVWINDFERAARDEFTFHDNDIGSKITGACLHVTGSSVFRMTWHLNKIDTYYKNRKRPFYWKDWSPMGVTYQLKATGSNAFAVRASMTTVVVFVVTTWFMM